MRQRDFLLMYQLLLEVPKRIIMPVQARWQTGLASEERFFLDDPWGMRSPPGGRGSLLFLTFPDSLREAPREMRKGSEQGWRRMLPGCQARFPVLVPLQGKCCARPWGNTLGDFREAERPDPGELGAPGCWLWLQPFKPSHIGGAVSFLLKFSAALGLHCSTWAFSSCGMGI